jgi:hypothetical protein
VTAQSILRERSPLRRRWRVGEFPLLRKERTLNVDFSLFRLPSGTRWFRGFVAPDPSEQMRH